MIICMFVVDTVAILAQVGERHFCTMQKWLSLIDISFNFSPVEFKSFNDIKLFQGKLVVILTPNAIFS